MQPRAALAVGDDADRRARLDVAQSRPVRRSRGTGWPWCWSTADSRRAPDPAPGTRGTLRALCGAAAGAMRVGRQRVRKSFEHEALRACARRDLAGVEVALGIDREVMQALEVARLLAALPELVEESAGSCDRAQRCASCRSRRRRGIAAVRRGRTRVRRLTAPTGRSRLMNVCVTYLPSGVNTCTRRFGRSAT